MVARPDGAERTFQHLDHDGYVTTRDFEQTALAIVEAFGVDESAAKAICLLERYRETCQLVLGELDANREGRSGPDEVASTLVTLSGMRAAEFADRDHGVITRTEFAHLLSAMGEPSRDVDAAFDALDRDHDGRITRDDYVAAWEDYLVSDNPDAAGVRAFAGL